MQRGQLSIQASIVLGAIIIATSILMASGVIKVNGLSVGTAAAPTGQAAPSAAPAVSDTTAAVKIATNDSPMLGNQNAPVTLIEFSDYECPFCKRHFTDVYPQIKKDYIDTGKVKLVYRNYPLSFHDPMATYEANAALCAKEQGGDSAYFKIHDAMFTQTTSNGTGLTKDKIKQIATSLGLNGDAVISCADAGKYKDKIAKDIADGTTAGVSGTPSFFVGKSSSDGQVTAAAMIPGQNQIFVFKTLQNGKVIGNSLVGAQPYTAFQGAIDGLLK